MTDQPTPVHKVFKPKAIGLLHLMRNRGIWGIAGVNLDHPLSVKQYADGDDAIDLLFLLDDDHGIKFGGIKGDGLADVVYGAETISDQTDLGSVSEVTDNRNGVAEIEVDFRDLFAQSDSKETDQSSGGSVKLTLEAEQSIEGVASFKQSLETEVHTEFSESTGSETSKEQEGDEATTVPKGKRVKITQTRHRADGTTEVSAKGKFTYYIEVGKFDGNKRVKHKSHHEVFNPDLTIHHHIAPGTPSVHFDSEQQLRDVVTGNAPDNWPFAGSFNARPAYHADLWALDPLDSHVRYSVKFEGRIIREFRVEAF